ncbi:hypothetical protein [Microbacterium sp. PA5]|uniref:hypothetical protein n=1 Tax=Microbacterium sp. PA5 TaxID=3416654 RepID=UPI003CED0739
MNRRRLAATAVAAFAVTCLALSGCASAAPPASSADAAPRLGEVSPGLPDGEVVGQGMVLGDGEDGAQLCLGPVAESAPPQCAGIPLVGWSWEGLDGFETTGGVKWGSYAVQGTYDGTSFTVTQPPIMLALYDPMAPADPTGGEPGAGAEDDLLAIQEELPDRLGDAYFASYPQDGWLFVDVLWDDGTWQDAADGEFGADTVIIRSALREIG